MTTFNAFLQMIGMPGSLPPDQEKEKKFKQAERQKGLDEAKAEVRYESGIVEAEATWNRLQRLPGAEDACKKIEKLIADAKKQGDSKEFQKACEHLSKIAGEAGKGVDTAKTVAVGVAKDFPKLLELQKQLLESLAKSPLTKLRRANFTVQLEAAVKPLFQNPVSEKDQSDVKAALHQAMMDFDTESRNANAAKESAEEIRKAATAKVKELAKIGTDRDLAGSMRELNVVDTLLSEKEFAKAGTLAARVESDADAKIVAIAEAKKLWAVAAKKLGAALETCKLLETSSCPLVHSLAPTIEDVAATLTGIQERTGDVGKELQFAEAYQLLQQGLDEVEVIKERDQQYADLTKERDLADGRIGGELAKAQKALNTLSNRANIRDSVNTVSYLGPNEDKLKELKGRWVSLKKTALSAPELQEAALTLEIQNLTKDIEQATKSDSGLDKVIRTSQRRQAWTKFTTALEPCRAALSDLEVYSAPEFEALEKKTASLEANARKSADSAWDVIRLAEKEAPALKGEIEEALKKVRERIAEEKRKADMEFQKANRNLEGLRTKIEQFGESWLTNNPKYRQYLKVLEGELNNIKGLTTSDDEDLLATAISDLGAMHKNIRDAYEGLVYAETNSGQPSLEGLSKQIAQFSSYLEHENLSTYLPATKEKLKTELNDIQSAMLKTLMADTDKKLANWNKRIGTARADANKAQAAYLSFENRLQLVKQDLIKEKSRFVDSVAYYDSLLKQLDNCLKTGKAEGSLALAGKDLERIEKEYQKALTDTVTRKVGQEAAEKAEENAKLDEARWNEKYKIFTGTVLPKLLKEEPHKNLYNEVVKLGAMANDTFRKTKDLTTADFHLNAARERALILIEYPQGQSMSGRNKLPQVLQRWHQTVGDFKGQLEELIKAIEKADAGSKDSVARVLEKVANLFNPSIFDAPIAAITKAGTPVGVQQRKREEALVTVRSYKSYLTKDARLKQLKANPFIKPFPVINQLNTALLDLEKNLMISL